MSKIALLHRYHCDCSIPTTVAPYSLYSRNPRCQQSLPYERSIMYGDLIPGRLGLVQRCSKYDRIIPVIQFFNMDDGPVNGFGSIITRPFHEGALYFTLLL